MKKFISNLLTFFFFCYMILIIYFLFFSEEYGRDAAYSEYKMNLTLFAEIRRYFEHRDMIGSEYFLINIVGNVVAFMPFGFLFPVIYGESQKRKGKKEHYFRDFLFVTFLGLTFSLGVETIQLITKVGCFDVDDLFMNTIGVMLGFMIYAFCKMMIRKIQRKK